MRIEGQSAIVTGANALGAAAAKALSERGASVAILDYDGEAAQQAAEAAGGVAIACDPSDGEQGEAAIAAAVDALGPIRILVNCVEIGEARRLVGQTGPAPLEHFEKMLRANLVAPYNMMRLLSVHMSELTPLDGGGERGVIVNTSSVAAGEGQIGYVAYATTKGAISAMTLPAARELAKFGVRVATIEPGAFTTPALAALPPASQQALGGAIPFPKRLGRPEEFGHAVLFIIENAYFNGAVMRLDAGHRAPPQ